MGPGTRAFFLAACVAGAATRADAAAGEHIGESQICVMSNAIEDTPVIDSRTILVRMIPGRGYKRIELTGECPSLNSDEGVRFATSNNRLCVRDRLEGAAREPSCAIARIVTIDEAEARGLMSRGRSPR